MTLAQAIRLQNFIGGRFTPGGAGHTILDRNPSDPDDVIAEAPGGDAADAAAAVAAAAAALPAWRGATGPARGEHLHRWAAAVAARQEEIAQAMAREVGKPIAEARGEAARCVAILRYYAGEAVREIGEVIPAQAPGALQLTLRQPLGVVALITPWNFPAAIPLWKAAPALAFGNTVVLKPSEDSPHVGTLLAETAAAAELPAGVFNVLLGDGPGAGEPLLGEPGIAAVSFTGSAAVGARVAAAAAARNLRYQTEMGGKNVAIVLADADLDLAAALTAGGAMRYAGQKCTATSRVVVARQVAEPFFARLRTQVERLPLGPVTDPAAAVGPLIRERSRRRVAEAVAAAAGTGGGPAGRAGGHGARVICGGEEAPADPRFARGWFFTPTVLAEVPEDAAVAREELFGPVLAAFTADDLEQAIAIANRTPYGLSAALFTRDLASALTYVQHIEAGLVRVNGDTTGVDPHAPFGGVKGSSSGSREQGRAAREFFTEIKTVQVHPA
ncbi:MAG TPA: aldehyde dehydrogenase family protein [Thermoanaerobaculia bacterium]|jgi:aldehyde dehydrogenase (NAD+)|nr:aldehyde dehydrogenase family protein [Thermoanaerobaculia bacterium]